MTRATGVQSAAYSQEFSSEGTSCRVEGQSIAGKNVNTERGNILHGVRRRDEVLRRQCALW
jgi:hypothetical protein